MEELLNDDLNMTQLDHATYDNLTNVSDLDDSLTLNITIPPSSTISETDNITNIPSSSPPRHNITDTTATTATTTTIEPLYYNITNISTTNQDVIDFVDVNNSSYGVYVWLPDFEAQDIECHNDSKARILFLEDSFTSCFFIFSNFTSCQDLR